MQKNMPQRNEKLVMEPMGEELLVYCPDSHQASCLNATAGWVLERCDGKSSMHSVAAALEHHFQIAEGPALLEFALAELSRKGLDDQGNSTNAAIHLRNCRLYVNGNLDLGQGGLDGDNATLMVNGHLVLREGNMEAADKGLVVMCNRLGVSAVGSYRGLLLIRDCCAFAKMNISNSQHPEFLNPLEIRGAIICGGGSAQMRLASLPESNLSTVMIRGVSLASARFIYDPRYLTWLQPISPYQLLHLERLPD